MLAVVHIHMFPSMTRKAVHVEESGRGSFTDDTFNDNVETSDPGSQLRVLRKTAELRKSRGLKASLHFIFLMIVVAWIYNECWKQAIASKHLRRLASGESADEDGKVTANLQLLAEVCAMVEQRDGSPTSKSEHLISHSSTVTAEVETGEKEILHLPFQGEDAPVVLSADTPGPSRPTEETHGKQASESAAFIHDGLSVAEVLVASPGEGPSSMNFTLEDNGSEEPLFDQTIDDIANVPRCPQIAALDKKKFLITEKDLFAVPCVRSDHAMSLRATRLLAKPTVNHHEAIQLLMYVRFQVSSMGRLEFNSKRHRLPSVMVNKVVYALLNVSNIERINAALPGFLGIETWWNAFCNTLNIDFDLGDSHVPSSAPILNLIKECQEGLRIYASGGRLPPATLHELLTTFFNKYAKGRRRKRVKKQ